MVAISVRRGERRFKSFVFGPSPILFLMITMVWRDALLGVFGIVHLKCGGTNKKTVASRKKNEAIGWVTGTVRARMSFERAIRDSVKSLEWRRHFTVVSPV